MIPEVVHQMWISKDGKGSGPPSRYEQNSARLRKLQAGWRIRWWDNTSIETMWTNSRELQRWSYFYHNVLNTHMERCDFNRYALLYMYGGLYLDLDIYPLKPLGKLLAGREAVMVRDHKHFSWLGVYSNETPVFNGFLAFAPKHWFLPRLMDFIVQKYDYSKRVMQTTGPVAVGRFCSQHNLLDLPELFVPTHLVLTHAMHYQDNEDAFVYTTWFQGSRWQVAGSFHHVLGVLRDKTQSLMTAGTWKSREPTSHRHRLPAIPAC